ncbi:class I SAM-dependent methyltransferase [Mycolicibacterium gadium]|jgi:methyltransferase (TIGR00027 family)|uniref:S-adenosyl-L-methionine-dependent methyltransferase n=1 Tax=Mycolicibacterium gadium TaxID=1794 RepID=A0A7I7WN61_MYCGU|nr:class I SAM-dependent methyltransferase [Mycolicibacterium gadium]BBZ18422.1 putative S-adenosyl-L-methionine-dependent methyltransferase [Mycolicibacterium gadium]
MARTDNDTWDLASSVGATATMVAAARAIATKADDALINDPFAEPLVRAVGVDFFTKLASGELRAEDLDVDHASVGMARMTDNMAVRTKFFDEFFTGAASSGVGQAVILASGLDSRAYRLAWPAGTTVYEIDQPEVIEFKTRTLADFGAKPSADRRTVAVDLRFDWPSALIAAGFEPSRPTAWSAEGLLGYLPPEAQDQLLDTITELSAVGSRVAVESTPSIDTADHEKAIERMQEAAQQWRDHGFELDFADLIYLGDRNEASAYLADRGWQITSQSVKQLLSENGLPPIVEDDDDVARFGDLQYVTGILES